MKESIAGAVFVAIIIALWAIIMALPIKLLWNYLMPTIFGLTKITLGQAFCVGLLSRCLFGVTISDKKEKN